MIRAQIRKHFAQTLIGVVALKRGSVLKFLGGIKHAAGVSYSDELGLLVTNQTSVIHQITTDGRYKKFTDVGHSYFEIGGLDNLAISDDGIVFVRSMANPRCVLAIDSRSPSRLTEIHLGDDRTPGALSVCGNVLFMTDHKGRLWTYEEGELRTYCDLHRNPDSSFTLTHVAADPEHVWVLDNRTGFYVIDRATKQVSVSTRKGSANQFSSMLAMNGHLFLSDFHRGCIYTYDDESLIEIASGLDNPTAMARGLGDTILVANFGTEGVARVVI